MESKKQSAIDYLKSFNPQPKDRGILICGSKYRVISQGQDRGIATWTKDDNIGNSFQRPGFGEGVIEVVLGDSWELIPKNQITYIDERQLTRKSIDKLMNVPNYIPKMSDVQDRNIIQNSYNIILRLSDYFKKAWREKEFIHREFEIKRR